MTFLGKLFVMLNLVVSLTLATVGFAVFANSVDYSNQKGKAGQPDGKLVPLLEEIKDVGKQVTIAAENWEAVRSDLLDREQARLETRQAYARELASLTSGKAAVRVLGPDRPDGSINLVAAEEAPGKPLLTLSAYDEQVQALRKENASLRRDFEAKLKENTALTNQLAGNYPEGSVKGLRRQLVEERDKYLGIVSEEGVMEGLRINALVEELLVLKRRAAVNESIEYLTRFLKVKHGVDAATK